MKKMLKKRVWACIMALVLVLSVSTQALAYDSVTCKSTESQKQVWLYGYKVLAGASATTYLSGTLYNYGSRGYQLSLSGGGTGCNYSGYSKGVQQHTEFSATGLGGAGGLSVSGPYGGNWIRLGKTVDHFYSTTTNQIHKSGTYTITAGIITSVSVTCFARIYYSYGGSGVVGPGEFSY